MGKNGEITNDTFKIIENILFRPIYSNHVLLCHLFYGKRVPMIRHILHIPVYCLPHVNIAVLQIYGQLLSHHLHR